ncbi:Prophage endopeptidase tail [compost metagenome]
MRKSHVTVYDLQMRRVAELENAFSVGYATPMNALWTASFSLPADDEKNAECKPLYFVEIRDGEERLELFRILPSTTKRDSSGGVISYQCEHVLATLLDDILFQYHTIGNLGVYTAEVLAYILSKQTTPRWQLGTVQFGRQFEYNWENENLLGALFSVPKPFAEEYQWTFDTSSYPWTLSLVRPSEQPEAYIRYGVNMQGITKVEDPTNTVTRIYGLGYGEGVNQLTFAEINGGLPYIQAEQAYIDRFGLITTVYVDSRIEYPETLLGNCQAMLNEAKIPRMTYTVDAAELYQLTNDPIDRFRSGSVVRVIDQELGIDVTTRVLNVTKQDIFGQPGAVQLEIANRSQDIAGTIADLRNRQYANEVYAQGATNLDTRDFADNCDPSHPAVLKFWIPAETVRINKVRLSFQTEAFRAYSKAIESAPAVSSGPSSRETAGPSSRVTAGPSTRDTAGPSTRTTSGPSSRDTTLSGGGSINTNTHVQILIPGISQDPVEPNGGHNHGIPNGTLLMTSGGGVVSYVAASDHSHNTYNHGHQIDLPSHTHGMDHTHEIDHTHSMDHTHDMDHTHSMDHTHEIPAHSHDIQYGIYEGPSPGNVSITVDGHAVPNSGTSGNDIDIIPYLSKDDSGKVQRGAWHTIQIAPDNLGRIVANVVTQLFVQSRGGGNY